MPRVARKEQQQLELTLGQRDLFTVDEDSPAGRVNGKTFELEYGSTVGGCVEAGAGQR